jgi:GntR family phosphonate transport system transcriptional regulator
MAKGVAERDGVALWRQIGDTLVGEIDRGAHAPGARLPASMDIARRFGVNRHTALRAIAHLEAEGLVRIERGRGAFVVENVIEYRLGARTRFEQNLAEINLEGTRTLLGLEEGAAPADVAKALDLKEGAKVVLAVVLAEADGVPLSLNRNWFPAARFPDISDLIRKDAVAHGTIRPTQSLLADLGVHDFRRTSVRVRSRAASADEARYLRMARRESILEMRVENVDADSRPVVYGRTSFASSRVELILEP